MGDEGAGEAGEAGGEKLIINPQCPIPNPSINFSAPKQLLEKSYMSLTIEIAETHVSVHSSHHTPPGLMFGRFLLFVNKF
jgi:hypothetical protein